MKRIISMMLAILMLAMVLVVNVNAAAFKDVSNSAYYAVAAQKLSECFLISL